MRRFITSVFFIFLFLFVTPHAYAEDNFDISVNSIYRVNELGLTTVTEKISIENKTEFIYTPSYGIKIGFGDLENVKVFDSDGSIPFSIKENADGEQTIDIEFAKRVVGKGRENSFTVSFETDKIAKETGSIWEVDVPGISNPEDFTEYSVQLVVPPEFGSASIIKPRKEGALSQNTYTFTKEDLGKSGIFILFGETQYYAFSTTYHISNSNLFPVKTEIALPPSTNYQDVIVKSLVPSPQNVYVDTDGNWLAVYKLSSQEKLNIKATGVISLYSAPREEELSEARQKEYLKPLEYWEVKDSRIQELAEELKTPQAIYNYLVENLSYNYEKVTDKNTRLGARNALLAPKNAVCLEFTDLFIALARATGIPARSVEGYARTENSKLKPLSLVKDILHAWPEYYDHDKKAWVMIDPTWGNTTKGSDYFTSLDFDHITFVINGVNSAYPIPAGGYKFNPNTKDIEVSFGQKSDFEKRFKAEISADLPEFALSGLPVNGAVSVKNAGNYEVTGKTIHVTSNFDNKTTQFYIDSIPPYGTKTFKVKLPKTPFLTNKTFEATILFEGASIRKQIRVGIVPDIGLLALGGGFIAGSILILIVAIRAGSIFIQRHRR